MDEVDPILERKQRDRYNVLMGFVKSADLRFFSTMLFSDYHKKYGKDFLEDYPFINVYYMEK